MSLHIAENIGYCFGVKRAMDFALKLSSSESKNIYTIGDIIHNEHSVNYLKEKGIKVTSEDDILNNIENYKDSILIIRAHGINKSFEEFLKSKSKDGYFMYYDYTCPYVKQIHKYLEEKTNDDTLTLLFGKKSHPEILGNESYIKGEYHIFSSYDEFLSIFPTFSPYNKCIILISQTTADSFDYSRIQEYLKKSNVNFLSYDSICKTTLQRQLEIESLSKISDYVYIVGDSKSSNTNKLVSIAKKYCKNTYLIESVADLKIVPNVNNFDITIASGASSPDFLIKNVIKILENS